MNACGRIWIGGLRFVGTAMLGAVAITGAAAAPPTERDAPTPKPPVPQTTATIASSPIAVPIRHAITDPYPLPAAGAVVPLDQIEAICGFYGLDELWQKIERDPPPQPFVSDGVTGWFDDWRGVSLYPAGFLHDLKYWAGYPHEDVARLVADAELMIDVAHLLNSTEMAETMFHGVRVGGTAKIKTPFRWGFGRP